MRQLEGQKVQIEAQAVMLEQQAEASERREEAHTRIVTQLQQQLAQVQQQLAQLQPQLAQVQQQLAGSIAIERESMEASKRREEGHTRTVAQLQQQLADSITKERESSQIFQNHLLQSPRLQRPKLRGKFSRLPSFCVRGLTRSRFGVSCYGMATS